MADSRKSSGYASPACSAHEMDPAYAGYFGNDELAARLNELVEAERAGAKLLLTLAAAAPAGELREALTAIQRDEGRYCGMLAKAVRGLGGEPSAQTGGFREKVLALDGLVARLDLLNRGQGWVVRRIEEMLPRISDDALHAALVEMRDTHLRNTERCERLLARDRN